MMGGNFHNPLHLLTAYGYCAFDDDICVNPSDAPYGRPTFANITFSKLFTGPSLYWPEVVDIDYAATPVF